MSSLIETSIERQTFKNQCKLQESTQPSKALYNTLKQYLIEKHKNYSLYCPQKGVIVLIINRQIQVYKILLVSTIIFNFNINQVSTQIYITKDLNKYILKGIPLRIILGRQIVRKSFSREPLGNLQVSIFNGEIKYRLPFKNLVENLSRYTNSVNFSIIFSYLINQISLIEEKILRLLKIANHFPYQNSKDFSDLNNIKYLKIMNLSTCLDMSQSFMSNPIIFKSQNKQKEGFQQIIRKMQNKQFYKFNSIKLYQNSVQSQIICQSDLQIGQIQKQKLSNILKLSIKCFLKNKNENKFISNHVKIKQPIKFSKNVLYESQLSIIRTAQINFWYVSSVDVENNKYNQSKLIQKLVAWKTAPKNNPLALQYLRHQIQIVEKLKTSFSAFIPKYYSSLQSIENKFGFLIDYHFNSTMENYLRIRKVTTSIWTKLHFLFNVVQGLRFLKNHRIIHLNIEPSNILISMQLFSKIIDFGQSYHPEKIKKYPTKINFPYTAPQVAFKDMQQFDEKQDVFSLGVLISKTIFGQTLINGNYHNFQSSFQQDKFFNRIFIAPEVGQFYGQFQIVAILIYLCVRCMNVDPQKRPTFQWIAIILKETMHTYRQSSSPLLTI